MAYKQLLHAIRSRPLAACHMAAVGHTLHASSLPCCGASPQHTHRVRSREHSVSVSGVSQHGTCGSHHYQTFLWYVLQGPVKSATHKPLLHDQIARSHPRHRRRAARVSAVTTDNRKKNQTVLSKTIKKTKYHFQIPHTNTTPKESRLGQIRYDTGKSHTLIATA